MTTDLGEKSDGATHLEVFEGVSPLSLRKPGRSFSHSANSVSTSVLSIIFSAESEFHRSLTLAVKMKGDDIKIF